MKEGRKEERKEGSELLIDASTNVVFGNIQFKNLL